MKAYGSLTERQREVLTYLLEGTSNLDISEALNISERTAEVHRANILRKFAAKNTTHLARIVTLAGY